MIHPLFDSPLPLDGQNTVVAIGNFDGVHRGHHVLLKAAHHIAVTQNMPLLVLTFSPHPRRFFRPESAPFLITDQPTKTEQLRTAGATAVVTLPFDAALAALDPTAFMEHILRDQLHAQTIVIGTDFHFGHNRAGHAGTLRTAGFEVIEVPLVLDHAGIPISSTRIRSLLQEGRLDDAHDLLGRSYTIQGIVKQGDQRGKILGFPTANIDMGDILSPAHGVYAAFVKVEGPTNPIGMTSPNWYKAAINIGHRPMFHTPRVLLEAHLLDFSGDLYDKPLRVQLVQRIRDEARFNTIDGLIAQMKKDCDSARKLLEQSNQRTHILSR